MTFVHPIWLYVGAASCAGLALLMLWSSSRRARTLRRFVGDRQAGNLLASLSRPRRRLKALLLLLGVAALFAALARPQWGYHWQKAQRQGVDLMFAVDTSRSMLAEDLRPNRLARAKMAVEDFAERVPGDRLGLIAFAGDAFLQTPLTLDRGIFSMSLQALDTHIIPVGGTDVAAAIHAASKAFATEPGHRKILVLLTDGEDLQGNALATARQAGKNGMKIYTVGIGTTHGQLIPVTNADGSVRLLRDASGQLVRSRLDEKELREIAKVTGGAYQPLGQSGQGLDILYRNNLASLRPSTFKARMTKVYDERFQWPLGLGLLLLLIEPLVGERRSRRSMSRAWVRGAAMAAAGLTLLVLSPSAMAAPSGQQSPVHAYNSGTTDYRSGSFREAANRFEHALDTPNTSLQQDTYYNLGNARYRLGQATVKSNVDQTIKTWKQAIASYEDALALNPKDADARYNRDFVKRKLAELEKRKQEQKQQQKQKQKGSKQQQKQGQGQQQKQSQGQKNDQKKQGQGQQQKQSQGQKNDQQKQGQGQQQKQNQGQKNDQKKQGQPQKPQGARGQSGQQQAKQQQPKPGQARPRESSETPATPGGLTRAQAARLLDSLAGDLHQLPSGYGNRRAHARPDEPARKDW